MGKGYTVLMLQGTGKGYTILMLPGPRDGERVHHSNPEGTGKG